MHIASVFLALAALASPRIASASEFLAFPDGFRWCVATAAYQIEGYDDQSDWWDWEQLPGKIKNGEKSGAACDHWNRLEQDTQLMKDLNVREYRFSIEWAKIEPVPGTWDWNAVHHYQREIALLRENGIEPMITLQHFTLPRWLRARGGWEWDGAAAAFARYSAFVFKEIAPDVRDWITLNEPMVSILGGYVAGLTPPGWHYSFKQVAAGPMTGFLKAHAAAYHALHDAAASLGHDRIRVGVAHHLRVFDPHSKLNPLDRYLAWAFDQMFNWAFGEAMEKGTLKIDIPLVLSFKKKIAGLEHTQDFVGVNYYTRDIVKFSLKAQGNAELLTPPGAPLNDLGWEIYPEGFLRTLRAVAKHFPGKAVFVTENGIADAKDAKRPAFLTDHLEMLHQAIQEGVRVEGYCHWSLMDNFEWVSGFEPRFGLYEMDYATQSRIPRASARLFTKIATENGVWIQSPTRSRK